MPGTAAPGSPWLRGMCDWCCKARAVGGPEEEPQGAGSAGFWPAVGEKAFERALMSGSLCWARWVSVGAEVAPQLQKEGLKVVVQGVWAGFGQGCRDWLVW